MLSLENPTVPSPVIMIPGDGGCQAYAEFIETKASPFPLWVDLRYLLTPGTFGKYFKLLYNRTTRRTEDNVFAKISFPGWGETWSIDNLDSRPHESTQYFGDLTSAFTSSNAFYKPNYTLRGTPFDFRKAPNENEHFSKDMQSLVEETYANAGDSRVVIVAHSLGTLYGLHFLRHQSDAWKKRYIRTFVAISGPLGGSMKALKIEASGDNFGIRLMSSLRFREAQRSMPSLSFLLPDPRLWPPTEHVIFTPKRNYSAHDYELFFNDIGFPDGYQMFIDTKASIDGFEGPTGVDEVYCIHGSNISTTSGMIYEPPGPFRSAFPDQSPSLKYEDGDGTVNLRSLIRCREWKGVRYTVLDQAEHLSIVRDQRMISILLEITNAKLKKLHRGASP